MTKISDFRVSGSCPSLRFTIFSCSIENTWNKQVQHTAEVEWNLPVTRLLIGEKKKIHESKFLQLRNRFSAVDSYDSRFPELADSKRDYRELLSRLIQSVYWTFPLEFTEIAIGGRGTHRALCGSWIEGARLQRPLVANHSLDSY